jgi:hypothetical protein
MVWAKPTERIHQVVENFCAAKSARDDVFLYYKIGRWQDAFPEKPYFLLSHCAHVLFSLWRVEEDGNEDLYEGAPRPTAFLEGLPFGKLRYTDCQRRLLHADSLEDHWRNETQWFKFWIQAMEHLDPCKAALYQEFCQQILAHVGQSSVLRSKAHRRSCKALNHFVKSDAAGHALRRALSMLDELMWGIVRCVAGLDSQMYLSDQITLLIGLLGGIRGTIVHQTLVKGPYIPSNAARWKAPFAMTRWFLARTQGTLTLVPKREGGGIICSYNPASGSASRRQSWVREASSLTGTYEQELFATWSYETGEYREDPDRIHGDKACWSLQHEEVRHLETLAQLIDTLLATLERSPQCGSLIQEVRSILRNGSSKWRPQDLPWTYVRQLDQLLDRLKCARQEIGMVEDCNRAQARALALISIPEAEVCDADPAEPANCQEVVEDGGSKDQDQPAVRVEPTECSSDRLPCEASEPQPASVVCEPDSMTVSSLEKDARVEESAVQADHEVQAEAATTDSSDGAEVTATPEALPLSLPVEDIAVDSLLSEISGSIAEILSVFDTPEGPADANETPSVVEEPGEELSVLNSTGENNGSDFSVLALPAVQPQPEPEIASPPENAPQGDEPLAPAASDAPRVRRPRKIKRAPNSAETASGTDDAASQAVEPSVLTITPVLSAPAEKIRNSQSVFDEVSTSEPQEPNSETSQVPVQKSPRVGKTSRVKSRSRISRATELASDVSGATACETRPRPTKRTRSTKPHDALVSVAGTAASLEIPQESSGTEPQPGSRAPEAEPQETASILPKTRKRPQAVTRTTRSRQSGAKATPRKPRAVRSKATKTETADKAPAKPRRTTGRKIASTGTEQTGVDVLTDSNQLLDSPQASRTKSKADSPMTGTGRRKPQRTANTKVGKADSQTGKAAASSRRPRSAKTAPKTLVSCGASSSWILNPLAD